MSRRLPDSLDRLRASRKAARPLSADDRRHAERAPIVLGDAPELDAYRDGYAVLDRGKHVLAHFEPSPFDVFRASDFVRESEVTCLVVRCADRVVISRRGPSTQGAVSLEADGLSCVDECGAETRDREPAATARCAGGQVA